MLFSYCSLLFVSTQSDQMPKGWTFNIETLIVPDDDAIDNSVFPWDFIHILYELIDLIDMYLSIQLLHHHILKLNYS